MKLLYILLVSFFLVETFGQRSRTTSTNQDASKEEAKPVRTRGRTRFSATEDLSQITEQPTRTTSNRRASTRTRIHSNNPKAAANRRARPTEPPRSYAVEEINNDSPIESFRRQSKPRVLSESQFEIPTVTAGRRPISFDVTTPKPSNQDVLPVDELGFGSTARAILQARGETIPPKTTTPVVDEEYLLTNFGSTTRSLAAASRGIETGTSRTFLRSDIPAQRATPLRSEIPILDTEEIPSRRSSLRGEPLPSLRGSVISLERTTPVRDRNGARAKLAEARANARLESAKRTTTEEAIIEEISRADPELEAPEAVQGLPENVEPVTETQAVEVSSESLISDEEDFRKTASTEVTTARSNYASPSSRASSSGRRNMARGRNAEDAENSSQPRSRISRTRPTRRPEESNTASSRTRSSRRRVDDAVVAESRQRGPSVFTAEQYQDVTARSRTGRRIDSRFESVPERLSIDLTPSTTLRSRSSGRRATTATTTTTSRQDRRDRNSRGRDRARTASSNEVIPSSISRSGSRRSSSLDTHSPTGRRGSHVEEPVPYVRKSSYVEEPITIATRSHQPKDGASNSIRTSPGKVTPSIVKISNTVDDTVSAARRPSIVESTTFGGRRVTNVEDTGVIRRRSGKAIEEVFFGERSEILGGEREPLSQKESVRQRSSGRRVISTQTPSRRRGSSRFEVADININEVNPTIEIRKEPLASADALPIRHRNVVNKQTYDPEETTLYYGEKARKTDPLETTTMPTTSSTSTERPAKSNTRTRSRFPDIPPTIEISKLEVLPLFEREATPLAPTRSRGHRSRSSVNRRNREDHMHISATENDVKFVEKPTTNEFTRVTVTMTQSVEASTSRARLSTRTASTTTSETPRRSASSSSTAPTTRTVTTTRAPVTTTNVPETTVTTTKRWITRSPPIIKESVVAEINQVTSKSTITRRKKVPKTKPAEVLSRGTKKAEIKLVDVGKSKNSDEEIGEEDNYPEPFKALIQAKKQQVGSSSSQSSSKTITAGPIRKITTTEKAIVTSAGLSRGSSTARIVTTSTVAPRKLQVLSEINDNENELEPSPKITTTVSPSTTVRPTRSRLLPKFSEKPRYQQKYKEKSIKSTEKPKFSAEKYTTKASATSRRSFSTKSYTPRASSEHHSRRKALRSTAFPPSTTPLNSINRGAKFSAKFVKKELSNDTDKSTKVFGGQQPKGLYSSKKSIKKDTDQIGEKTAKQLDVSLIQTVKPVPQIKKLNASRYSSRYRSDISARSSVLKSTTSAPFYIPTIPTPAYIPTVPTVTPPVTSVDGIVAVKDSDLGVEVISFDDPVNSIPSADLVNGEFLTTDKNLKLSPMVKNGTTEKPVSIIERIINSITLISTTAVPNTTTTDLPSSATTEDTGNSAILKLATKKSTLKDKTDIQTNIIETITSEKPTTIIEKIRSSLSAIQTNEVGTSNTNIISRSTTPLSTVTKYSARYRDSSVGTAALPAPQPLSTSINPLSVFDEINENEVLEKRTIGKLLNILNGLASTKTPEHSDNLVVVTPKSLLSSNNFVATTYSPQEPIEAISLNGIEPRAGFSDSSSPSTITSESTSNVNTESTPSELNTVNTEISTSTSNVNTDTTTTEPITSSDSTVTLTTIPAPSDSTSSTTATEIKTSTENNSSENIDMSNLVQSSSTLPPDTTTTSPPIRYTETPTNVQPTSTTDVQFTTPQEIPTVTVEGSTSSTRFTLSTIPSIPMIEVSPGSVSIFSANDLSNFITPEDNLFNTVTIASRVGFDNNLLTSSPTESVTSPTEDSATNGVNNNVLTSTSADGITTTATEITTKVLDDGALTSTTTEAFTTTNPESISTTESATFITTLDVTEGATLQSTTTPDNVVATTTSSVAQTTTVVSTTMGEETTTMLPTTTASLSMSSSSTNIPSVSSRSGRILSSDLNELIGNSIDISTPSTTTSTTPDYFIFAVLNNNTILRKRPPTIPNKEVPFVIVGLLPNNTVVRKFPNGTLVPMDPVIKVRGFDTRPNPPPLIEITSNQVTDTNDGLTTLDNNSATVFTPCVVESWRCKGRVKGETNSSVVESNRMARVLANEQRVTDSAPRVVTANTSPNAFVSTTAASITSPSTTTDAQKVTSSTSTMASTTAGTTTSSTTPLPSTLPSNSIPDTTPVTSTSLPTTTPLQSSEATTVQRALEIMAVPGETRISKSQATTVTSAESSTAIPSSVDVTAAQASASTVAHSTESIPSDLGEILNGRTVDAFNNLIKSEQPPTKAPNYETLQVNKNSITSSTTEPSTITSAPSTDNGAPFTSNLSTETITPTSTNGDMSSVNSGTDSSTTVTSQTTGNDTLFTSPTPGTEGSTQVSDSSDRNTIILSSTESSTFSTPQPTTGEIPVSTSILSTESMTQLPNSSDRLLSSTLISTIMPVSVTTPEPTTQSMTTTPQSTTTTLPTSTSAVRRTTQSVETTTRRVIISAPPKTTTTGFPTFTPSTIFPSILTTLFPNLLRGTVTTPRSHISSTKRPLSSAESTNSIGDRFEGLFAAGSTARPTTVLPQSSTSQRISTTTTPTTTTSPTTTQTTTTTTTTERPSTTSVIPEVSTTKKSSKPITAVPTTKEETDKLFEELKKSGKLKNLSEEQRRNLEEIEKIEKEQAELIKQLSVLTTMFGGQNGRAPRLPLLPNPVTGSSNLANRVIAMAMERDKSRSIVTNPPPTKTTSKKPTTVSTKRPNSIQDQLPVTQVDESTKRTTPSLEDVLKQYNLDGLSTPAPLTSTYGKTDEALLASILKEQGIGPTTPKILADKVKEAGIFEEKPTTTKPKPRPRPRPTATTARPIGGRLMQGLNWLLDILDPPTTKRPAPRKNKPKSQPSKQEAADDELLTNQPTRITPMVTAAPVTKPNLSQEEIQELIKQLEAVQKNPNAAEQLDFSKIKSLQNLINVNEGVEVTHTGQHGATSRATPRPPKRQSTTEKDHYLTEINRKPKASTQSTLSVSNSIDEDVKHIPTTVRNRIMPPVSLNPIPGIDDQGDSMIRSNLLTAAVNVTRAISSFLGSALQGATQGFRTLIGSGSSVVGNIAQTSSAVTG